MIGWAMAFGFSMATVSMLKLWAWMEIEKNTTVREIKRLELQVAMLTQRLENRNEVLHFGERATGRRETQQSWEPAENQPAGFGFTNRG